MSETPQLWLLVEWYNDSGRRRLDFWVGTEADIGQHRTCEENQEYRGPLLDCLRQRDVAIPPTFWDDLGFMLGIEEFFGAPDHGKVSAATKSLLGDCCRHGNRRRRRKAVSRSDWDGSDELQVYDFYQKIESRLGRPTVALVLRTLRDLGRSFPGRFIRNRATN